MRRSSVFALLCVLVAALALTGCGPKVPNVVGMGQADAVRALQDAGYKLGEVTAIATDTVPLGMVAAQTPAADDRARKDTAVDLAVNFSDGTRVRVPTVIGETQVTAENVAETLRLVPLTVEQYSETVPKGEVASQSPEPNAEVSPGSTLVIVVSNGVAPTKVKVPGVVGKTEADAEKALSDAGFPDETFKVYDSTVAKGKVISQLPESGTSAVKGSTVQIVVSLGAGTGAIKVPSVTGKKEADANSAITSAGLKVKKVTEYSSSVAKGVVSQQFPSAGSTTASGAEVLIVVSLGAEPSSAVAVPDVMGKTVDEATTALKDLGFTVTVEVVASEDSSGTVGYQFPAAGAKAAPGSEVLIVHGGAAQ